MIITLTSGIPSNHGKGGQSQGRFHRKREEAIDAFFRRVQDECLSINPTWEVVGEKTTVRRYEAP